MEWLCSIRPRFSAIDVRPEFGYLGRRECQNPGTSAREWRRPHMATASPLVYDISDTARWAAVFRARESQRPDALFCDRFALRLAGPRGIGLAETFSDETHNAS